VKRAAGQGERVFLVIAVKRFELSWYIPALNSTRDSVTLSDNKLEFRSHGFTCWYINGRLDFSRAGPWKKGFPVPWVIPACALRKKGIFRQEMYPRRVAAWPWPVRMVQSY